jgi:hypothetical protein
MYAKASWDGTPEQRTISKTADARACVSAYGDSGVEDAGKSKENAL